MVDEQDIKKIKELVEECLGKMTMRAFEVNVRLFLQRKYENFDSLKSIDGLDSGAENSLDTKKSQEAIDVDISLEDPQFLIGQNGQTLLEFQRVLRIMLNKKLGKSFYINLDINEYKKRKVEHLKNIAIEAADEVLASRQKKVLAPMSAYERRIIHAQLSGKPGISTESQGEGDQRCVVIKPQ